MTPDAHGGPLRAHAMNRGFEFGEHHIAVYVAELSPELQTRATNVPGHVTATENGRRVIALPHTWLHGSTPN